MKLNSIQSNVTLGWTHSKRQPSSHTKKRPFHLSTQRSQKAIKRPIVSALSVPDTRSIDDLITNDLLRLTGFTKVDKILNGAHIIIENDQAQLYNKWQNLKNCRPRSSSHYLFNRLGQQYAITGSAFTEVLFGQKIHNGKLSTWFQAEASPAVGGSFWSHAKDFLIYILSGKNIGPQGTSNHTDRSPIILPALNR